MILSTSGEQGIPERQLRLGLIAANEIAILGSEARLFQKLFCEQKTAATIEEQACSFRDRNGLSVKMVSAAGEDFLSAGNDAMAADQIVAEHRNCLPLEILSRLDFEFNVQPGLCRERFAQLIEFLAILLIVPERMAANEEVKEPRLQPFRTTLNRLMSANKGREASREIV